MTTPKTKCFFFSELTVAGNQCFCFLVLLLFLFFLGLDASHYLVFYFADQFQKSLDLQGKPFFFEFTQFSSPYYRIVPFFFILLFLFFCLMPVLFTYFSFLFIPLLLLFTFIRFRIRWWGGKRKEGVGSRSLLTFFFFKDICYLGSAFAPLMRGRVVDAYWEMCSKAQLCGGLLKKKKRGKLVQI